MEDDRTKWDRRYGATGFFIGPHPSQYLVDNIVLIKSLVPGGKALDLACGEGRNSIFLARHGFAVTGLDISSEGLAKADRWAAEEGLAVTFRQTDLEGYEFSESWDLIVNFNFLLRDLVPKMVAALASAGVIVFDTILDVPSLIGHHNKAFLLQPGELAALFAPFPGEIIQMTECPEGPTPTAKLIYRHPADSSPKGKGPLHDEPCAK
ncbi:MAG TPA: class I SAM-dependent methyltransferase [Geobacteraceae bacterium]